MRNNESQTVSSLSDSRKRVLFVNPAKEDNFEINRIHMGSTLLGGILIDHGHEVKVMDYSFLRWHKDQIRVPSIEEVVHEFKPDVIGISVFTYLYDECQAMADRISRCTDAPIMLGGPHFIVFPYDFRDDPRVSYIVRGEAESVIVQLVENARSEPETVFIEAPQPRPEDIPAVNLEIAYGSQYLTSYQLQLSRGCPYNCSFCSVRYVAGRRIRERDIDECLDQISDAKKKYPNIRTIAITDDCPTFKMDRFKTFLRKFEERALECSMFIDNVRANLIDEELIKLYKAAGGTNICLGIESGHQEVFKLVHKGESIEEIVKAAKLVHKYGLKLGGCFIIGLPGDNPGRFKDTEEFAKSLKLDYAFWNMVIPWPGTAIYEWYKEHGEIGNLRNFSPLIDRRGNFRDPPSFSADFPKKEMIAAWLRNNMERKDYFNKPRDIGKLFLLTMKYGLYSSFYFYFLRCFLTFVKKHLRKKLNNKFSIVSNIIKKF